jgi:chromosome partitioning protein
MTWLPKHLNRGGADLRITAIVNPKGGTGKTTTAVNLATSAALEGERVLLVDMDKQGSATQWLGHSPDNEDLVLALLGDKPLDSIAVPTLIDRLELVPASVALAETEKITREPGHQYLLREALDKAGPRDWVILDAPGDLGPLTIMTLTAASEVLIPVPAGALELDEIPKIQRTIEKVRARLNPELSVAGVLLTQVRIHGFHTSVLARQVGDRLREDFPGGELLSTFVRDDGKFREAPGWRQPMAIYDPDGKGDQDYRAVLTEIRKREIEREVVGVR